jgi:hypothetical protein
MTASNYEMNIIYHYDINVVKMDICKHWGSKNGVAKVVTLPKD